MVTVSPAEAAQMGLSINDTVTNSFDNIVEAVQEFAANMLTGDAIVGGSPSLNGTIPNSSWYQPAVLELAEELDPERVEQIFTQARAGDQTAAMSVVYMTAMIDPQTQPEAYTDLAQVAADLTAMNDAGTISLTDVQASILGDIIPPPGVTIEPTVTPAAVAATAEDPALEQTVMAQQVVPPAPEAEPDAEVAAATQEASPGTPIILENGEPLLRADNGAVVTREAVQAGLIEMSEGDATYPLSTYQEGLTLLNPAYADFFDATEVTAGVFNNSIANELQIAFNEDPAAMRMFIGLADDPEGLALLTTRIQSEQGATHLTQALAEITGRRGLGELEAAPTVGGIINNQREMNAGLAPSSPAEGFTPFEPVDTPAAPAQPVAPAQEAPVIVDEPAVIAAAEGPASAPAAATDLEEQPSVISYDFNVSASIEGLQTLSNGLASDDMRYLQERLEEARIAGVDPALIESIESQIGGDMSQFVTTEASIAFQAAYSQSVVSGLEDGTFDIDDHANALTAAFQQIASGDIIQRNDVGATAEAQAAAERLMEAAQAAAARGSIDPGLSTTDPVVVRTASFAI